MLDDLWDWLISLLLIQVWDRSFTYPKIQSDTIVSHFVLVYKAQRSGPHKQMTKERSQQLFLSLTRGVMPGCYPKLMDYVQASTFSYGYLRDRYKRIKLVPLSFCRSSHKCGQITILTHTQASRGCKSFSKGFGISHQGWEYGCFWEFEDNIC
jgi:hypothetical protein